MMGNRKKFFKIDVLSSMVCMSLSFSFMFFIYAPLELFLSNTSEFWFDMNDLLPAILACFMISSLFLIGIGMLFHCFLYVKRLKVYYVIYAIFLTLFLGLYIQGNYIPRDYGVLNGTSIDWSSYTLYAVASVVVWIFVIVFVIVLYIKFQKYIFQISKWLSMAIFVMLSVALASLIISVDMDDLFTDESDSVVVTDKNVYSFSEEKNIIVLVLDTFDAEYLRVLLDEDTYSELLEDFTFYTNAVGGYPTTKGSIPLILSGEWYENDIPYEEWVESIYADDTELYSALKENDYTLGFYTTGTFLTQTDGYYENVLQGTYQIDNYKGFISSLYKLISFEYVPHQLKRFFQVNTSDFDAYKKLNTELTGVSAWTETDESFYVGLINEGISVESTGNVFRFIHLYGMHQPYVFGENVVEDGNEYTYLDAAKGNMNEVKALLNNLKENGIYDNTAIIIMADHGGGTLSSEMSCNPLLLVKSFDEHHDFEISQASISWVDIYPTLVSWVTGTDNENAVWNIDDDQRTRRFLYYDWDDAWDADYLPTMTEYYIVGDISDESATITSTGNQYLPGSVNIIDKEGLLIPSSEDLDLTSDSWEISIPIDDNNSDFNDIYVSGLGEIGTREDGTTYAWSEGNYTIFKLQPEGEQAFSYVFTIYYDEIYNPSDLTVSDTECMSIYASINGDSSETDIQFSENSLTITIPVDSMQEESVIIMIGYPYAELNEDTGQKNALAITGIKLEPEVLAMELETSLTLDFSENGNIDSTTISGWNGQESSAIWSTEESSITFLSDDSSDITMQMDYSSLSQEIETSVYMNGNFVCVLSEENAQNIVIPKEYLNPVMQTLTFLTEDATSPQALGMSDDSRTLGIFVKEIILSKNSE